VTLADGGFFWIKDDGVCSEVYGGNKVRKLEFLLAAARQGRKNGLIVHGDVGSHTVQACGLLGRQAGFDVQAVVFRHRNQSFETPELARLSKAGVRVHRRRSMLTAVLYAHWVGWRTNAWVVPLGASKPVASLGHVRAALELLEQLQKGHHSQPRRIYIPFATGGSVAGLLIGLALAGASARVVAVQTVETVIANRRRLRRLVRKTLALLGLGATSLKRCMQQLEMIDYRYLGRGYRDIPKATEAAVATAAKHGLCLETAFSGKAFAALLDALPEYHHGELLFWNTHDWQSGSANFAGIK
jgi:D-cysteine desulfhydrase